MELMGATLVMLAGCAVASPQLVSARVRVKGRTRRALQMYLLMEIISHSIPQRLPGFRRDRDRPRLARNGRFQRAATRTSR